MKSISIIFLLTFLSLLLVISGCNQSQVEPEPAGTPPASNTERNIPSEPSSPIQLSLFMSHAPLLNETVEVICTISSVTSCPNSTAEVRLPDGATLVSGNLTWEGDVEPGDEPISFSTKITFHETGKWKIEGVVRHMYSETSGWSDLDTIYITVGTDYSEFGWPRTNPVPVEQIAPGDVEPVPSTSTGESNTKDYPNPPSTPVD